MEEDEGEGRVRNREGGREEGSGGGRGGGRAYLRIRGTSTCLLPWCACVGSQGHGGKQKRGGGGGR